MVVVLILLLIATIIEILVLWRLSETVDKLSDLSPEDEAVKSMTQAVEDARSRLPHPEQKPTNRKKKNHASI